MAAYILSPERWRDLSTSSPVTLADGQQQQQQQTPTGQVALRRRISRVFYESPVSSPVAIRDNVVQELAVAVEVEAARRSPGQRSQDSGFSGYSGDSASEGSASSNNSPVPVATAQVAAAAASKRSPLVDTEAAERALAAVQPGKVLETDLDATPSGPSASGLSRHVSRIYIRTGSPTQGNLNLRDVICEKNIQPVNLSGGSSATSPDKNVGDKSLIGAVLASNRNNNNNVIDDYVTAESAGDRSGDSQTALLMEHKSIVPPSSSSTASLRPNLSWKKLSESFRRVISSGRMMAASSSPQSCIPTASDDQQTEESFTDEEKSRMLLLAKRTNLRRTNSDGQVETVSLINRLMTESPQPTSRYVGGPRSSTPRKNLPATTATTAARNHINNNNNNVALPRRCSRSIAVSSNKTTTDERPHRVRWADAVVAPADPIACTEQTMPDAAVIQGRNRKPITAAFTAVAPTSAGLTSSCWPDNSTWDSDTPSLEIGQQLQLNRWTTADYHQTAAASVPTATVLPTVPETGRKIRRGLRMGIGASSGAGDRSALSPHLRRNALQMLIAPPPPPLVPPVVSIPTPFQSVQHHQNAYGLRWSPVEAWLKDLPMFYQPESTCALQNKAIGGHLSNRTSPVSWTDDSSCLTSPQQPNSHQSDDEERTYSATVTARAQVRRLQRRAHLISTEFAQLCSFIELYEESKLSSLIPLFLAHVIQFIREAEQAALPDLEHQKDCTTSEDLIVSLRQTCSQLVQLVTFSAHPLYVVDEQQAEQQQQLPVNWSLARQVTAKLGQVFVAIVDAFVGREIQVLTDALKSGRCVSAARLAANSLMSLGADAARPAMRPLIEAFQLAHLRPVRADLLRALSALCSSTDIIQEFDSYGGLAVIFEILCNPRSLADAEEKSEAAGLLAQITSPWLDPPADCNNAEQQAALIAADDVDQQMPTNSWPTLHLTPYISPYIAALTELSGQTDAEETLLLSTAALANLTFSHSEAVQLMAKYRTAQVLVEASDRRSKDLSVFIQDQIATILANMAAVYSVRADLVSHGALTTLLNFLQTRPSPLQRPAEVTASERVLKKSAIALSRICGENDAARQIVELQGIERLSQLVRDPRERNHSDGVLVACLAALHKIATACGTDELERRGSSDLIENRLLDVFLEYSSRPESYV